MCTTCARRQWLRTRKSLSLCKTRSLAEAETQKEFEIAGESRKTNFDKAVLSFVERGNECLEDECQWRM